MTDSTPRPRPPRQPQPAQPPQPKSPHFFDRQSDGSVRLRIRFSAEEAALYEQAAGDTPMLSWIHDRLAQAARADIEQFKQTQPRVRPTALGAP